MQVSATRYRGRGVDDRHVPQHAQVRTQHAEENVPHTKTEERNRIQAILACPKLIHMALEGYVDSLWKEQHRTDPTGDNVLRKLRLHKGLHWWGAIKAEPLTRRRRERPTPHAEDHRWDSTGKHTNTIIWHATSYRRNGGAKRKNTRP